MTDKLMEQLTREVERLEHAYKMLPCDEMLDRLHKARLDLSREEARRAGL